MTGAQKVVVAMSGGVDSSVAASLLIDQGYEVEGLMLQLWNEEGWKDQNRGSNPESIQQARNVASTLNIPFRIIDAQDLFRTTVVHEFLEAYRNGLTPNPCALCNRVIRFGFLLEYALRSGAEFLATGHYARISTDETGEVTLLQGLDRQKDQSYMLSRLNQFQLSRALFPLGNLEKTQVRDIANSRQLSVANRPDSQDLCFITEGDYRFFIRRHAPELVKPGKIINLQGETLGTHQGLAFFTIGQRQKLGVSSPVALYVLRKDLEKNILIVGHKDELDRSEFTVNQTNWISQRAREMHFQADVKIRYKARPVRGLISLKENGTAHVSLSQKLSDITAGQLAVFYDQETVLGSGIIE